jgi:hypothetical protein
VLIGLAGAGLVIWWARPDLIQAALPLLFVLACPLSMVLMMRAMNSGSERDAAGQQRSRVSSPSEHARDVKERLDRTRAEAAALERELARLENEESASAGLGEPRPRELFEEQNRRSL